MLRRRNAPGAVVVALAACALASCAPDPAPSDPARTALIAEYKDLLTQGREAGMSEAQERVLEQAINEGRPVTFEEYKGAVEDRIECLEGLGFKIAERREIPHGGWTEIDFLYGGLASGEATDAQLAAASECYNAHAGWVDLAYQSTGTAEQEAAQFEEFRSALLECLKSRGANLPSDATQEEILVADEEFTAPDEVSCSTSTGFMASR